ncbi:MAG: rhodanese domain-containing protein [Rickettsiaceae bacterium]|nr:rhodanese domain-containing protein [Rickettsiaceae bacterium]
MERTDNYSDDVDLSGPTDSVAVLSFYSFVNIPQPEILLPKILLITKKKYVRGTIILAKEGFNGSISSTTEEHLHLVIKALEELTNPTDISIKVNYCSTQPFSKIKVKLKNEIVSMKAGEIDVESLKGKYVETSDWDRFIQRSDVIVVDTRNSYEIKAGTFKGALDPHTESFREFPEWARNNTELFKNKKIAMFCTGGIRCEKSTAYMKALGYEEVYHLKGGILQYLEDTKNENGVWEGNCFVFDDRGAVDSDLLPSEGYWVQKGQNAKSVSRNK